MNSILQTPESLQMRRMDILYRLGPHLIIGIATPNGFAFGRMFDERAHQPQRWIWFANAAIAVAGIGDLGDFRRLRLGLEGLQEEIDALVFGHYMTTAGLANGAQQFFEQSDQKPKGAAIEVVFADIRENCFWLVDFDSRVKNFSDFIVAGCRYKPEMVSYDKLTEEERASLGQTMDTGSPEETSFARPVEVRGAAVKFLEEEFKKHGSPFSLKKPREALKKAEDIIIETLRRFDTESPTGIYEIVSCRQGSRKSIKNILQRSIADRRDLPNK